MLQANMTFTRVQANAAGKISWRTTTSRLSPGDRLGGLRVRWDIGRDDYRVEPGLYACGAPGKSSPVLVTANYKLTFDLVRKELENIDAWLLVLDTKGVNVWCAAGKGSFGTTELLHRIKATNLANIVSHRDLVVPQLGATGVSGYRVTKESGFRVHFGPVYARDLPAYLANGMKKTRAMTRVRFTLGERLKVAPVELVQSMKFFLPAIAIAVAFALPPGKGFAPRLAVDLALLAGAFPVGTILFPMLMPMLPFRAFSAKGAILGLAWGALCMAVYFSSATTSVTALMDALPAALIALSLISFLAMNFTGSSTFTCQKGAELEVRRSIVPQIAVASVGATGGAVLAIARCIA
jgi:hypothetical protein